MSMRNGLRLIAFILWVVGSAPLARAEVLIIADEFPAMETVAANLKSAENIDSQLVWQTNLPPNLATFQAVMVYIHKELAAPTEAALIDYTRAGGKLVVLHHSISSGKRKNKDWFHFLGVTLPLGDVQQGGYKWIEGVTWSVVNLNPGHFITTNKVSYPERIPYNSSKIDTLKGSLPGFTLEDSEVYLNHVHNGPRTLLLGLKYTNDKTGVTYMQDTAGWMKPAEKGWIVYLMAGHTKHDFENPVYSRIVANAVIYRP